MENCSRLIMNFSSKVLNATSQTDSTLALRVSFGLISLLSISDNLCLCFVMLRRRKPVWLPYEVLMLNLAVTDLLTGVAICLTPGYLLDWSAFHAVFRGFGGEVYCRLFGSRFFLFSLGKASTLTVMFMAIDRWFAVVKPLTYRRQDSKRRVTLYLVVIWFSSCLLQLNKTIQYKLNGLQCRPGPLISGSASAEATAALIVSYTFLTFYLPSIVTWLTFAHIWFTIQKSASLGQSKTKMRLLRMCAIVAFFLTVCWFPTETMYTLYPFHVIPKNIILHRFTVVLAMVNSILNPIIYCLTNQQYKKDFIKVICCFGKDEFTPRHGTSLDIVDENIELQMGHWDYLSTVSLDVAAAVALPTITKYNDLKDEYHPGINNGVDDNNQQNLKNNSSPTTAAKEQPNNKNMVQRKEYSEKKTSFVNYSASFSNIPTDILY